MSQLAYGDFIVFIAGQKSNVKFKIASRTFAHRTLAHDWYFIDAFIEETFLRDNFSCPVFQGKWSFWPYKVFSAYFETFFFSWPLKFAELYINLQPLQLIITLEIKNLLFFHTAFV